MEILFTILKTLTVIELLTGNKVASICRYKPCDGIERHTMCLYPPFLDRKAPKCSAKEARAGLSRHMKRVILNKHNEFRQRVALGKESPQPSASNMMKLTWNLELEAIAQRLANACERDNIVDDKCRNLMDGTYVGQSFTRGTRDLIEDDRTSVMEGLVHNWFEERLNIKSLSEIDKFNGVTQNGKVVGHYTQLIWATTTMLGCGYIEQKIENGKQPVLLICNYAKGGNVGGETVYLKGKFCGDCPDGIRCSQRFVGLCTDENNEYNDVPKSRFEPRYRYRYNTCSKNQEVPNIIQICIGYILNRLLRSFSL